MLSKDVISADKPKGPELMHDAAEMKPQPEVLGEKVPWPMGGLFFGSDVLQLESWFPINMSLICFPYLHLLFIQKRPEEL